MKKACFIALSLLALSACDTRKPPVRMPNGFQIVETKEFPTMEPCQQQVQDQIKAIEDAASHRDIVSEPTAYVVQVTRKNRAMVMLSCNQVRKKVVYTHMATQVAQK